MSDVERALELDLQIREHLARMRAMLTDLENDIAQAEEQGLSVSEDWKEEARFLRELVGGRRP